MENCYPLLAADLLPRAAERHAALLRQLLT